MAPGCYDLAQQSQTSSSANQLDLTVVKQQQTSNSNLQNAIPLPSTPPPEMTYEQERFLNNQYQPSGVKSVFKLQSLDTVDSFEILEQTIMKQKRLSKMKNNDLRTKVLLKRTFDLVCEIMDNENGFDEPKVDEDIRAAKREEEEEDDSDSDSDSDSSSDSSSDDDEDDSEEEEEQDEKELRKCLRKYEMDQLLPKQANEISESVDDDTNGLELECQLQPHETLSALDLTSSYGSTAEESINAFKITGNDSTSVADELFSSQVPLNAHEHIPECNNNLDKCMNLNVPAYFTSAKKRRCSNDDDEYDEDLTIVCGDSDEQLASMLSIDHHLHHHVVDAEKFYVFQNLACSLKRPSAESNDLSVKKFKAGNASISRIELH